MKKLLTTFAALAAASVASAATGDTLYTLASVDATGGRQVIDISPCDVDMNTGWTLQFNATIDSLTSNNWPVLASMGEANAWNFKITYYQDTNQWQVDRDGYEQVSQTSVTHVDMNGTQTAVSDFATDGAEHTYTLTFSGTTTPVLTLYIDGYSVATLSSSVERYGQVDAKVLTLGGKGNGTGNALPATFSDVVIYEGVVVPTPATPAVPEPATATLSLLALTGLAARRRRK